MDPIKKIRTERERLAERVEVLEREYLNIVGELEATRAELDELNSAIHVVDRFAGDDHEQAGQGPQPQVIENDHSHITAKDAVWAILSETGSQGLRSGIIKKKAQNRFGIKITSKTCGNILWRLKEQGKAHREGHLWYPVEQPLQEPTSMGTGLLRSGGAGLLGLGSTGLLRPSGALGAGTRTLLSLDDESSESEGPDE